MGSSFWTTSIQTAFWISDCVNFIYRFMNLAFCDSVFKCYMNINCSFHLINNLPIHVLLIIKLEALKGIFLVSEKAESSFIPTKLEKSRNGHTYWLFLCFVDFCEAVYLCSVHIFLYINSWHCMKEYWELFTTKVKWLIGVNIHGWWNWFCFWYLLRSQTEINKNNHWDQNNLTAGGWTYLL